MPVFTMQILKRLRLDFELKPPGDSCNSSIKHFRAPSISEVLDYWNSGIRRTISKFSSSNHKIQKSKHSALFEFK